MAHKGEALVRFNGLEAVNGDGLAVAGAAPRKAPSQVRFAVQSRIDAAAAPTDATFAPALRRGGSAATQAADAPEPADDSGDEAPAAADSAGEESAAEKPAREAAQDAARPIDDEMSALLASLDASAAEPTAHAEAPLDPDLEDLLKSLG
jgi:hypothetical protein